MSNNTVTTSSINKDSVEIFKRNGKSFLNNEVRDYAKYVIETRAMPNIMDGMRVGARKIIWGQMTGDLAKKAMIKMPAAIGDAMKNHYNHSDASLMNTIIQLCSTHVFKYAPFEVIGQIGTLRIPKCNTAPRYLHIKKKPYLDIFKTDGELLDIQVIDGDESEPKYFLPIIPLTLMFRTNSPGFGFSFRSFSYDVNSIIDNCIKAITNGSCYMDSYEIPLVPAVEGIKPENMIYNANKDSWYNVGEYTMNLDTDQVIITDLPFDVSFENLEEHYNNLVDKGYIVGFKNLCLDGNIKYILQFSKGRLRLLSKDAWKFFQSLKLFSKVTKDTLNLIDEDGKTILFFQTPYELIDAFVTRRLRFYMKRKTKTIAVIEKNIQQLTDRINFIKLVTEDKLIINKRPIADIKSDLDSYKLPHDVLKLNIEKLTRDEIQKMEETIIEQKANLDYIRNTPIQEMYVRDLIEFKSNYCKINNVINV